MPSDSHYERIYEAEDKSKRERKKELIEKLNKMSLEEKIEFLINEYIIKQD